MIALASACGSSKPTAAPATKGEATSTKTSERSDFCDRYSRMYCRHNQGDSGEFREESFDELTSEDQSAVMQACEASYSAATEAELEAMESCLGGVQSCDVAERCITR